MNQDLSNPGKLDIPLSWFLTIFTIMLLGMGIDYLAYALDVLNGRVMMLFIFIIGIDSVFLTAILSWAKYKGVPVMRRRR